MWTEKKKPTKQNLITQLNLNVNLLRCNENKMAASDDMKHLLGPQPSLKSWIFPFTQ